MVAPPKRAVVFDIETRIDWNYVRDSAEAQLRLLDVEHSYEPPESYKDPVKLAAHHTDWWMEQRKKWTFSPLTAEVVAIAHADLWEGDVECTASDDEYEVLATFAEALGNPEAALTGYNIRRFDVPFVTARCAIHAIELPWWWPHDRDYRRIADVFDVTQRGGCQKWLERCGLPLKTSDGASVEHMTIEQVHAYCSNDVHVERLLAQRFAPNMPSLRSTKPTMNYDEVPI